MLFKLELVTSKRRDMIHTMDYFDLLLNGKKVSQAYYNTRGYCLDRGLPTPDGLIMDPGEISLTRLKREIATLNRQAKGKR